MRSAVSLFSCFLALVPVVSGPLEANATTVEVRLGPGLTNPPTAGRLLVILSPTNRPEPRLRLGRTGRDAPQVFAQDLTNLRTGTTVTVNERAFGYPARRLADVPAGDYVCQGLFAIGGDLNFPNAPGSLYSLPQRLHLDPAERRALSLELTRQLPPEQPPPDTADTRFIKLQSNLLSQFHHRPMYLRAGIVLPRDYEREPARQYPLWVRIGGLNTRCTIITRLMAGNSDFRRTWLAPATPRFILLQLDGAGPYGDPYYVNSANNGPCGDALVRELVPYVEAHFRVRRDPAARVLSGVSTGGWVALALQVFYPGFFNGAWSFCPDPVDFRSLELLNIYEDANAYVDGSGNERPSERKTDGGAVLATRQEVGAEMALGRGDTYTTSGQQWGAWNAAFGPRGPDGLPAPLWDPQTGKIDRAVAAQWRKYDLRAVLQDNWPSLGPQLKGKLHIAAAEADQYFLNDAVHRLDEFLSRADPPYAGRIVFGPRKRHGWTDVDLAQMLNEMAAATHPSRRTARLSHGAPDR